MLNLFPPLEPVIGQRGWTLSGGERQALAIAQGLMARPDLLMLDEPSLGLAPVLVQDLFATIRRINKGGTTILLVEQNVRMALSVADRAFVVELGETALSGGAEELMQNPEIQDAYLGGHGHV
jgi:branched-chain amino acid transport system ATP-binding protein